MWKEGLKVPVLGIIIVAVICAVVWVWEHHLEQETRRQQDQDLAAVTNNLEETKHLVAKVASTYNAVTDWTEAFGGNRFTERLTVKELAPVLSRNDRRPLLVIGSVVQEFADGDFCILEVDAKANLLSNIRLQLSCTSEQVKDVRKYREEARQEFLRESRDGGETRKETSRDRRESEAEAYREARRGFAVIAKIEAVRLGDGETIDDPPAKAQFIFAEGRCLELLYVYLAGDWRTPGDRWRRL